MSLKLPPNVPLAAVVDVVFLDASKPSLQLRIHGPEIDRDRERWWFVTEDPRVLTQRRTDAYPRRAITESSAWWTVVDCVGAIAHWNVRSCEAEATKVQVVAEESTREVEEGEVFDRAGEEWETFAYGGPFGPGRYGWLMVRRGEFDVEGVTEDELLNPSGPWRRRIT